MNKIFKLLLSIIVAISFTNAVAAMNNSGNNRNQKKQFTITQQQQNKRKRNNNKIKKKKPKNQSGSSCKSTKSNKKRKLQNLILNKYNSNVSCNKPSKLYMKQVNFNNIQKPSNPKYIPPKPVF